MRNPPQDLNSAGNYQTLEEESTRGMEFHHDLLARWTRNPPEEWNSAGNYWLINMDSEWQDQKSSDRQSLPRKINF
jgi:hypothetical protein